MMTPLVLGAVFIMNSFVTKYCLLVVKPYDFAYQEYSVVINVLGKLVILCRDAF